MAGTTNQRIIILLLAALPLLALLPGCGRDYPQDSPDAVLVTARKMIEQGDARRLPDLIYADSPEMRALLNQMGRTLGSLEDLAVAVQKAYPTEIANLKAQAEAAAKSGQASSHIQQLLGQMTMNTQRPRGRRGGRSGGGRAGDVAVNIGASGGADPAEQVRSTFDNALKEIFADPYAWLAQSEGRLTVKPMSDDTAAILWDDKPVFGVGLTMRLDQGKWYVQLPTYAPGIAQAMPRTQEGWEIIGGLFVVIENTFNDLAADVRKGRCRSLDDLAAHAGEKMFLPAVMVGFAYGKYTEAERREARQAAQSPPAAAGKK